MIMRKPPIMNNEVYLVRRIKIHDEVISDIQVYDGITQFLDVNRKYLEKAGYVTSEMDDHCFLYFCETRLESLFEIALEEMKKSTSSTLIVLSGLEVKELAKHLIGNL